VFADALARDRALLTDAVAVESQGVDPLIHEMEEGVV
jgi:hypothetical protein